MALTATERQTKVLQLYDGIFGAAPGAIFLQTWQDYLASNHSVAELAQILAGTAAFYGKNYSPSLSASQFANAFVNDFVGNRAAIADKALVNSYVVTKMAAGATQAAIVSELTQLLGTIPPENASWGAAASYYKTSAATRVIDNLVGDSASVAAKGEIVNAVVSLVDSGRTLGWVVELLITALDGVDHADATWGKAASLFDNRIAVARYYSVDKTGAATDLGTLQQVLVGVTDAASSVATAKAMLDTPLNAVAMGAGYLAGATVFVDMNGDGVLNSSEASVISDAQGSFILPGGAFGHVVAIGGTDIATKQPFIGSMTAPAGSTVVTPLTTLMQSMVESGASVKQAQTDVLRALGLPATTNLLTLDPMAQALGSGSTADKTAATQVEAATAKVTNILVLGAAAIQGASNTTSATDAVAKMVTALANNFATAHTVVDLTQAATLKSVMTDAVTASSGIDTGFTASLDDIATLISSANTRVNTAITANPTDYTAALSQIAKVQVVVQSSVAKSVEAGMAVGNLTATVSGFTGAALDSAVAAAVAGNLTLNTPTNGGTPAWVDTTPPVITSGTSATVINENSGAGQVVYTATSTDTGAIATGWTVYSLKAGSDAGLSINASTGAVTLVANPDYESKPGYSFTVVATDAANNAAEKAVTLAINNLNEAPVISSGGAGAVAENAPLSTVVYSIASNDPDANDSVSYSLSGADAAAFTIDSAGAVRLVAAANFEAKTSYSFNVLAMDRAGLTVTKPVTIAVTNVDEVPVITSGGAGAVTQNAALGTVVYSAASSDVDANDSVSYSLSGTDAGAFSIDSLGVVRLNAAADYAVKTSYSFNVMATDRAGLSSSKTVTVAVIPVGNVNAAPTITSGGASAVAENAPVSTVVYRAVSSDPDANDSVSYSLSGADAAAFTIDSVGAVRLVAAADFETKASYSINVVAMDRAGLTATKAVTIAVANVDEAPVITSGGAGAAVAEKATAGAVVYSAVSSDPDANDSVSYSLSGADAGAFSIDSLGVVRLNAAADYAVKTSYSFNVLATDRAGLSSSKTVTVAVIPVGNVNAAPTITSGGAGAVAENAPISTVVYRAVSSDPDANDSVSYSLSGVDAAAFTIDSVGAVRLVTAADFETKASYSINVVAMDRAGLTATKAATIAVANVDEAPVITSSGAGAVTENAAVSTVVYTVTASDQDSGDTLSYSLTGTDAGFFNIVSNTGVVTLKASADYETKASYSITVVATDNGVGSLSGSKAVTVSVIDVPEPVTTITTTITGDGTRVTTTVTTNPDGSRFTEVVEVAKNGTTVTTTTELAANGTQSVNIKQRIDGASVTETTLTQLDGSTVNLLTIDAVPANRQDTAGTTNADRADIALYYSSTAKDIPATTVALPTGVGLLATGVRTPVSHNDAVASLNTLLLQTANSTDAEKAVMRSGGQTFLSDLANAASQAPLIVNAIKFSQNTGSSADVSHPITISGTTSATSLPGGSSANPVEVLVIDTRDLPSGSVLELQDIEFTAIIGNITLRGGNGANIVFAGDGSQNMVLGAGDDILHGGGGNDVVGSKGGNDQLFGDDGNDTLVGGLGNDHLEGGAGNDLLVGGQSDAGQLSFSQLKGQLTMKWTPSDPDLADSVGWSTTGNYDGGIPIDPRLAFMYQSSVMRETVTELYKLLFYRLPTIEEMNTWCSAGYSVAELEDWGAKMLLKYVLGLPTQYQVKFVMGQVWGVDKVTDAQIQSNSNLLNTGGTWAQLIEMLIKHDNFKAALLNADGSMTLTQSSSVSEIGWSSDAGADTLLGGAGNDTLVGGRGNDVLDGGAGIDTALWFGTAANFEVKIVGNGTSKDVALLDTSSGEVDIIRSIEQLQIGGVNFDATKLESLSNLEVYLASHADHHLQVVLLGLAGQA